MGLAIICLARLWLSSESLFGAAQLCAAIIILGVAVCGYACRDLKQVNFVCYIAV